MKKTAFDFVKSNPIAWIALFFAGVFGIYYLGRKSNSTQEYDVRNLPNSGKSVPDGWAEREASGLVDDMHNALSIFWYEIKWTGPKILVMTRWYTLTDDQVTILGNLYNSRYGEKDGVSIVEAVEKQSMGFSDDIQNKLAKRLRALNFK
ncbi:hypothetical protein BWI97_14255 [Siphonobacter sp. BAB-5405]|uniref:hypothetical protein n=1 Tax=Siphonobacter sp. BAB-5405 TaxID=1864825 RepID=UPI000C7FAFA8|nr:hypothetical protein [Siphonobacter sp. BAB-5405]PMD95514.1 hypothetical protein BWI97_14255 [Siphonobacter sp. BAB-5405]